MSTTGIARAACPMCGWTDNGRLIIVDRCLTGFPLVPRRGKGLLELYLDDEPGPDGHVHWCPMCHGELSPENVTVEEAK